MRFDRVAHVGSLTPSKGCADMVKLLKYGLTLVLLGLLAIFVSLWLDERVGVPGHHVAIELKLLDEVACLILLGSMDPSRVPRLEELLPEGD